MKTNRLVALVDCNNFFVSCERVFQPELRDRPVAVLSSNDGCIIARSNEVKALGVPMGAPHFQFRELLDSHRVVIRSSNFQLYRDMSNRVMDVLRQFSFAVDIYSIDEAFLGVPPFDQPESWATQVRDVVHKNTGIPVSVGVAPTRTLAKAAARLAKSNGGVMGFVDRSTMDTDKALREIPVEEVWGVGRHLALSLRQYGVCTAYGLKMMPEGLLQRQNVVTRRLVMELRGRPAMGPMSERSKSMVSSRSFGRPVTSRAELVQALSTHAANLGRKLRQEGLVAGEIVAFITTGEKGRYFSASRTFPVATDDSRRLIRVASSILSDLYRPDTVYKKAGAGVYRLFPRQAQQLDLSTEIARLETADDFNGILDSINRKWGPRAMTLAAEGIDPGWLPNNASMSPRYTTEWDELKLVN